MNETDDVILEYLRDIRPSAEPPTVIHFNIHNPRRGSLGLDARVTDGRFALNTLRNRLDRLEDVGLVEIVREKGRYRAITEDGLRYLRGELDVSVD